MTKAEQALEFLKGEELNEILWGDWDYKDYHEEDLYERRWHMTVQTTFEFDDESYVAVRWGRGLTENQENEGPYAIYLVEPYVVTETKFRRI